MFTWAVREGHVVGCSPLADASGFTLIEVLVTLFIIGLIVGLGASVLFPSDEARLREAASRLAGTFQYLRDEAAVKNQYYLLVFDLEGRNYRVELSQEPFITVPLTVDEDKIVAEATLAAEPAFEQAAGSLVETVRLPEGVKIKDLYTAHEKRIREEGQVFVYFLPNGWVEPSVLNLSDDEETKFYSLEINPLTGRAKIRSEYFEVKAEDYLQAPSP